jgi:tRNA (guanine-N7-)-methyltransferase
VLKQGGRFRLATDWQPYAEWMLEVLNAAPEFANVAPGNGCVDRPDRGETRFEDRGRRLGHRVFDLEYVRR